MSASTRNLTCSLLSSCPKHSLAATAATRSGHRDCLRSELEVTTSTRRWRCEPACRGHAPFCHGRCVFGGRACFFHPCSRSPYRVSALETCSQLAYETSKEECMTSCAAVDTHYGAVGCQTCLEGHLPDPCRELSGSSCWYCIRPVILDVFECQLQYQDSVDVLKCIKEHSSVPQCVNCTCTLLCYYMDPQGPLCKACQEDPVAATLFIHHELCPQGWTFSGDGKCFKAHSSKLSWSRALDSCKSTGGILAEPKTEDSIRSVVEAINLESVEGQFGCWIGATRTDEDSTFVWTQDNSPVETENWAPGFPRPAPAPAPPSCSHQTGGDAFWRNYDCSHETCFVCQTNASGEGAIWPPPATAVVPGGHRAIKKLTAINLIICSLNCDWSPRKCWKISGGNQGRWLHLSPTRSTQE